MRIRSAAQGRSAALFLIVAGLAACGGGGSSPTLQQNVLTAIGVSPLAISLSPGATQQLTVTGTYSNATTAVLAASGESFASSNPAVATVSAAGLVTVVAGAAGGATASITVTDPATGVASSTAGSAVVTVSATLSSISLAPLTVTLAQGGTQQLSVSGTYSDGTAKAVAASGESFASSNAAVASVSAAGLATVAANAPFNATATITATDTASGFTTAAAASTVITVAVGPTVSSVSAANTTVVNNVTCASPTIPTAYYWEIGNAGGTLLSGIHADAAGASLDQQGNPISAGTSLWSLASASKWVYATYVIQVRGSANILNGTDPSIPYLNFTSGYTYLGNYPPNSNTCTLLDTVDQCLAGLPTTPDPTVPNAAAVGAFWYDSDHMEEHATKYMGLGADGTLKIQGAVQASLGTDLNFVYSQPILPIGIYTTASDYALFLQRILSGQYAMSKTLSANSVCTNSTVAGCNAVAGQSPITTASNGAEAWHYSMGHWIEDDPKVGDGSFSSPGALGFYPWIDKTNTYYGIIARADLSAEANGTYQGYESAVCGRLIRRAFLSGVVQTGSSPD